MRTSLISILCAFATMAGAQTSDPVVMTVNGQNVTRSEFEYSYNKNNGDDVIEKTTVEQYVPLFVNYKLKVAAALDARDGSERALSELQNLADSVLLRLSFEPVAAALSVRALDKPRFRERCHNAFEIFERELFALGNLLERDKSAVLFIFGKIRHDAQGVSAAA